jgi:sec-independent protein translocase protein TatB
MGTPPTIQFASIGMADSLILMVMALVVFGPRRLPQIGRQIGKLMYEFRKASNDFKFQMEEELRLAEDADRRKKDEERRNQLAQSTPAQESVSADPPPAHVNAVESPYPGEGQYPEGKAQETVSSEETAPRITDAVRPEEATPRIMPPSTGETVAAARPAPRTEPSSEGSSSEEPGNKVQAALPTTPHADEAGEKANSTETAAPTADSSAPATEAVSHNG